MAIYFNGFFAPFWIIVTIVGLEVKVTLEHNTLYLCLLLVCHVPKLIYNFKNYSQISEDSLARLCRAINSV